MKLILIVTIQSAADVALAQRPVAGQAWIVRLVDRLRRATSIGRIVIACGYGEREVEAIVGSATVSVVTTDDPTAMARDLDGDHDGVVFCPVTQLFADPQRLDAIAALDLAPDTARAFAVLSGDATIALTGGAFVEVVTRFGLRAAGAGEDVSLLKTAVWPTWPAPPEMRLEGWGDLDWAVLADEALQARDPSGAVAQFEDALDDAGLRRFGFWDEMGPPPQSILTIRCQRKPLFEQLIRYLNRLHGAGIDVVCRADLAEETRALRGVAHVITFDTPSFNVESLSAGTLDAIRGRHYDLCVVPRREPSGRGFDNVVPLAQASGAGASIWLDIFGRTGLLAGRRQGWDASSTGGPHERPDAYLRRAVKALDVYARTSDGQFAAPAIVTGPSEAQPR